MPPRALCLTAILVLASRYAPAGARSDEPPPADVADITQQNDTDNPNWLSTTRCTAGAKHGDLQMTEISTAADIGAPMPATEKESALSLNLQEPRPYRAPPARAPPELFLDDA